MKTLDKTFFFDKFSFFFLIYFYHLKKIIIIGDDRFRQRDFFFLRCEAILRQDAKLARR